MAEGSSLRQRHAQQLSPSAPPPSYEECVGVEERDNPHIPHLTHDEARKALLRQVNKEWFVSKSPAIEFDFVSMQPSSAYRYQLETFTESRTLAWEFEPYTGQSLDTPERGSEPGMWSVTVHPPTMFEARTKKVEMPHTATQENCHECYGVTRVQCWKCKGRGKTNCAPCSGSGLVDKATPTERQGSVIEKITCGMCKGSGFESCSTCNGKGHTTCETCSGAGRVKKFHQLTVTWKVNTVDRIIELTGLDHSCLRKAQGKKLLQEESIQATPIKNFPIPSMRIASQELIHSHATAFPEDKILMQRQTIFFIPVHEVTGQWKDKQFSFWVYDYDNSAHCTEYPGNKCDCDCSVL